MTRRPAQARAFLLLEMIAVIVLLTAFALIASRLFSQTMKVIELAPAAHDAMTRFESVAQTLRQDAWGGGAFTTKGSSAIQIQSGDRLAIRWAINAAGDIERTQGNERRTWQGVGADAVLVIDGPCIVLRSTSKAADQNGEIRCPSLLQLSTERGPSR